MWQYLPAPRCVRTSTRSRPLEVAVHVHEAAHIINTLLEPPTEVHSRTRAFMKLSARASTLFVNPLGDDLLVLNRHDVGIVREHEAWLLHTP